MKSLSLKNLLILFALAFSLSSCYFETIIDTRSTFTFNDIVTIEKNINTDNLVKLIDRPKGIFEFYENSQFIKIYLYDVRDFFLEYKTKHSSTTYHNSSSGIQTETKTTITKHVFDYTSEYYFVFINERLAYWGNLSDIKRAPYPNITKLANSVIENHKIYNQPQIEYINNGQ